MEDLEFHEEEAKKLRKLVDDRSPPGDVASQSEGDALESRASTPAQTP